MRGIKFRVFNQGKGKYQRPLGLRVDMKGRLHLGGSPHTTVEQYIGIQDVNGVDIYEGDIYTSTSVHRPFVIKWKTWKENKTYGHGMYGEDLYIGYHLDGYYGTEVKVIGNIHENPDLYKE